MTAYFEQRTFGDVLHANPSTFSDPNDPFVDVATKHPDVPVSNAGPQLVHIQDMLTKLDVAKSNRTVMEALLDQTTFDTDWFGYQTPKQAINRRRKGRKDVPFEIERYNFWMDDLLMQKPLSNWTDDDDIAWVVGKNDTIEFQQLVPPTMYRAGITPEIWYLSNQDPEDDFEFEFKRSANATTYLLPPIDNEVRLFLDHILISEDDDDSIDCWTDEDMAFAKLIPIDVLPLPAGSSTAASSSATKVNSLLIHIVSSAGKVYTSSLSYVIACLSCVYLFPLYFFSFYLSFSTVFFSF